MAFLGAAAGLLGSLFSHNNNSGFNSGANALAGLNALNASQAYNPQLQALAAQTAGMTQQEQALTYEDEIKSVQTNEEMQSMSDQSSRAQIRASALATITTRHEGLMQSIQQAESAHVKSSFDLVKNS